MGDELWDDDKDFAAKDLLAGTDDKAGKKPPAWPNGEDPAAALDQDAVDKRAAELEAELTGEPAPETEEPAVTAGEPEPEPGELEEAEEALKESGAVQKRIDELTFKRREAERREAASSQELTALKARLERLEQGDERETMERFKVEYAQVKADLKQAFENGDSDQQVELTERLADMRTAARLAAQHQLAQPGAYDQAPAGPAAQAAQPSAPAEATSWFDRNKTWFNNPAYEQETTLARAIDVQLDLEGYDKDSPDYYTELDTRLKNVYTDLPVRGTVKPRGSGRAKSKTGPVAPAGASKGSRGGKKMTFSPDEAKMARELGLTSPEALKAYREELDARSS